jgi:shikimate kinase
VVVVGLMGAGKTTLARALAEALHRPLRDSDPDLLARYGRSAAEQVAREGLAVLHAREARHLADALADAPAGAPAPVIAAAASVVDDRECRRRLADAFVVWLDAPPAVLARRIHAGDHRPHHETDLETVLEVGREQRAGRFEEVADLVVDVSGSPVGRTVETVLAALARE